MSETWRGAGWWKASDGRWYPPESFPSAPPPWGQTPYQPPGFPPERSPSVRRGSSLWIALGIAVVVVAAVVGVGLTFGPPPHHGSTNVLPSPLSAPSPDAPIPQYWIHGQYEPLPPEAYEGHAPGDLVDPSQAQAAAFAVWSAFVDGLDSNNTTEVSEAVAQGSALSEELLQCAWPAVPSCSEDWPVAQPSDISVFVPQQSSYPLYFLAQMKTSGSIVDPGGSFDRPSVLALVIFTRQSPSDNWKIALRTAFDGPDGSAPTPFTLPPDPTEEGFDPPPTEHLPIPAASIPGALAAYWQHWKDSDSAPASSPFAPGIYTSDVGETFGKPGNGPTPDGTIQNDVFSANPSQDGLWQFTVNDDETLVCSDVRVAVTAVPEAAVASNGPSGALGQNPSRTNWGPPLQPGPYSKITTFNTHATCVLATEQKKLQAFGMDLGEWAVRGVSAVSAKEAAIAACQGDAESVTEALTAYRSELQRPDPVPEPWSAQSYLLDYIDLMGLKIGNAHISVPPDTSKYVIEFDSSGNVYVEPGSTFSNSLNPADAFENNPGVCDVASP
jgi:hypothetical protein